MKNSLIYGLDEIGQAVDLLYKLLPQYKVFALSGSLGAGKTTLIQKLLHKVGVQEAILSPTFTYVMQYTSLSGEIFYHFDLYRIRSIEDFQALGFDEYLYARDSKSFIEWPEVIMPLLTHDVCNIYIDYHGTSKRIIKLG